MRGRGTAGVRLGEASGLRPCGKPFGLRDGIRYRGKPLLELQRQEIPAIPHVDAIVCQVKHRDVVCEVIGKHVLDVSGGVCCSVAGVRYEPGLSEAA